MNRNKPEKYILLLQLGIVSTFIVLINSCGGGDTPTTPTPPPVKPTIDHVIQFNGNIEAAQALVYDGGSILSSTSTDANGDAQSIFTNKESVTTVDSVVVKKEGYTKFKQVNQAIGTLKTYNFSLDPLNTTTHGDLSFKMIDNITRDTILNYAVVKNLDTIRVAKEYVEENILLGDETSFKIIETDSVSRNFSQFDKTYEITSAQNNFVEEITSTPRVFETQQTIVVQGNDGHRVDNLTLQILGQDYEVPPDGIITRNFALDEDSNNPGHELSETINLILKQTDSSHALVNEVVKELVLNNGVQQDTIIGNTLPINRWANYVGTYGDETNNALSDVNVTLNTQSGVTDVNGVIRLDNIVELVEDPLHWWKSLDGQETVSATKTGFLPYSRSITLQVGDNNFTETMIAETSPIANSTINLRNQNTQNFIQNILIQYNGTDLAVNQDYVLNNVTPGDYTLTFKKSDSTYQMFTDFSHTFTIPEGNSTFTLDVDAVLKTFEAQYNLDVDDSNNNTLENINAAVDGVNYTLPTNGVLPTITFPLDPDTNQPWIASPKNISVALNDTPTSYQFTTQAHTFNLFDGVNTDNTIIATDEFIWLANLVGNAKDENTNNLPGATLSANNQSAITDAQGQARIDGVVQLPAGANFWEPGTTQLTYTMTKDGYTDQTPKTITVNQGDNIVNETLTQIVNNTYGSATINLKNLNTQNLIQNIIVQYNGVDLAVDQDYNLNNVLTGDHTLTFKQSDSTYQLFTNFTQTITIPEGNSTFTLDVDAVLKTFEATLSYDADDVDNQDVLTNAKATIDNVSYILPADGVLADIIIPLNANAIQPWIADPKTITSITQAQPTSNQFATLTEDITLVEGVNSYNPQIDVQPYVWYANLIVNVDDQNAVDLPGVTLSANAKTAVSDAQGQAVINQVVQLPAGANFWESGTANVTYDLVKDGYQDFPAKTVTVSEGDNSYTETLDQIISNTTGDVGIVPYLNGNPKGNTVITLTNSIVRDSTYTLIDDATAGIVFNNVYVSDANNPTTYEIKIVDNLADGTFLETNTTIDIYQDENRAINGNHVITLNMIPNEQDITSIVYDYSTLTKASGVTVDLIRDSDNAVIDSQVSDALGEVFFDNVPGSTNYHLRNSKSGNYTKTNGSFSVPLVDLISEMTQTMNVTTVPQLTYSDATPVAAADIQKYKPLEFNTEFLLGHLRIYFPPAEQRQTVINQLTTSTSLLGMPGAMIPYDTEFPIPTLSQIDGYDPYPSSRQVYDGLIGTNITNYVGTATGREGKTLPNGNSITFYTSTFNLGGLDWSDNDHEFGNALGFPLLTGNTSRSSDSASNTTIADSLEDSAIMPFWIRMGKLHYDTTDSQGRLIEYSLPTKFE